MVMGKWYRRMRVKENECFWYYFLVLLGFYNFISVYSIYGLVLDYRKGYFDVIGKYVEREREIWLCYGKCIWCKVRDFFLYL